MSTQCPKCSADNPDTKQFCGDCGTPLEADVIHTKTLETPTEELTSGSTFAGRYQIIEELGSGGMGKVYRVLDKKLKEEVALKLIRHDIAQDKKTVERFQNELKLARKIGHRNVGRMYELLEDKGIHYITMEYVSGQDLKGLIKQTGKLAIPTVLSIAKQVCEGLGEAHKLGVVHRDLKPSNIMIDKEGSVRIMDFGIARYLQEKGITGKGIMIGTPEYMSPEQVEAADVDGRSDIYSLGVVLYELTTGKLPFEADTPFAIGVKHKSEIPQDPKILNPQLSDDFRNLILKCLEKDKNDRFQNSNELLLELEHTEPRISSVVQDLPKRRPLTSREVQVSFKPSKLVIPIICLTLGILIARLLFWRSQPSFSSVITKTEIDVSPAKQLGGTPMELNSAFGRPSRTALALSPDGKTLVYYGVEEDDTRLYLRHLDQWEGIPLEGTEGARHPFFSPYGQWIGFWVNQQFMKISVEEGLPATLCESPVHYGASWGSNNKIVHSRSGTLQWFPDAGGEQETLISPDINKGEFGFYTPHVLPGAKAMLFCVQTSESYWENPRIQAYIFRSGERIPILDEGADPRYSPSGHLLFLRQGRLFAAPFDIRRLKVTGEAVPVLENVMHAVNIQHSNLQTWNGQYTFSQSGTFAYVRGGTWPDVKKKLVMVDRKGIIQPLTSDLKTYSSPRVSPDDKRLCYFTRGKESDIWICDIESPSHSPLTYELGTEFARPIWSMDGKWVIYYSKRGLFRISVENKGDPEILLPNPRPISSISSDGKLATLINYSSGNPDIEVFHFEDRKVEKFLTTPYSENFPTFSPDDRYIAYSSDETDRYEVYIQPYPGPGKAIQVSLDGGSILAWHPNGRELFYFKEEIMMSVDLTDPSSPTNHQELFDINGKNLGFRGGPIRSYDITKDGNFITTQEELVSVPPVTKIYIIQNWFEELKRLCPPRK